MLVEFARLQFSTDTDQGQKMNANHGEPQGCLAAILALFGIKIGQNEQIGQNQEQEAQGKKESEQLPYRRRDDFLSPAELSFYRVLAHALGNRAIVCPKVNLADIFFVASPQQNQRYRNKIDRKHVDFLLCDPNAMTPRCGLELDDSSHARADRQERDLFVDEVFRVGGLPLVRVPAKAGYNPASLLSLLESHLQSPPIATGMPVTATPVQATPVQAISAAPPLSGDHPPVCPKCGVPMVQRVASKGKNAGQQFFGCPNYPKCREVIRS